MELEEPAQIRIVASAPRPFVMGINYWPRRKAMYWWKEFDPGEARGEMAEVASLGAQVVRIFLTWEDFQPEPWVLNSDQLDNLGVVLEAAHDAGLAVMPTFLTGNMSGLFWLPRWTLTVRGGRGSRPSAGSRERGVRRSRSRRSPGSSLPLIWSEGGYADRPPRDIFDDPFMLRAELLQVRGVVSAFAGHPAIFGWDLANELDEVRNPATYDGGWLWSYLLCEEVHKIDPAHPVTYGAHPPSLARYNGMSVADLAETNDYLSIHGYPLYSDVARGPLDPDFVPFLNLLVESLGSKPTLLQEFGLCSAARGEPGHSIEDEFLGEMKQQYMASEEEGAAYYREVLEKLYRAGSLGAFAWCFADYAPELWDRPPFDRNVRERSFGLTRADGSLKPAGAEFHRFAKQARSGKLKGWGSDRIAFPTTAEEYYRDPERHFREMYAWYLERMKKS